MEMPEMRTNLEQRFVSYRGKALKKADKHSQEMAILFKLFMGLSQETQFEIDAVASQLDMEHIRNMGLLSCFELAMKLAMYEADPHGYTAMMRKIQAVAEKRAAEVAKAGEG